MFTIHVNVDVRLSCNIDHHEFPSQTQLLSSFSFSKCPYPVFFFSYGIPCDGGLSNSTSLSTLSRKSNNIFQPPTQMYSPDQDLEGGHRRRTSATCWTMFCAWFSFFIWTVVIFLLIFGIVFFAFVRSNLPDVKLHRLDIYKLDVIEAVNKSKNMDTRVAIDVEIFVNVTNSNKKMTLQYSGMQVETMIERFSLPNVRLEGFRQTPLTTNDLKIHPREMRLSLDCDDDDDATELKFSAKHHEMLLNLKIRGEIEFWYKGRMVSRLGLKVSCDNIEQSLIDQGIPQHCHVKLSFFSR
ncbi:hypothetical protein LXL04_019106 [Taraxacum kok-saghyz]